MKTTPDTADVARQQVERRYPRQVRLADGHDVELRLMGDGDVDAVLAFAQGLSPDDLMYLRVNITERPVVEGWVASIRDHRTLTALAVHDGQVLGEASLFYNTTSWTRHLGELRIQIAPIARRRGLARILADEIDANASELGLQLLTVRMTLDQTAAQAVFRRLGFQREAVLWDYVITPDGKTRNVLVATKRL
jgi:RimJ/RimL family protein N-acetyltransferase